MEFSHLGSIAEASEGVSSLKKAGLEATRRNGSERIPRDLHSLFQMGSGKEVEMKYKQKAQASMQEIKELSRKARQTLPPSRMSRMI